MNMNRAFFLKKEAVKPEWLVVDAKDQVLGRLATKIADMLRGKNKPSFTPHQHAETHVVVVNAQDVVLTGNKWKTKIYDRYSGWMGGYKVKTAEKMDKTEIVHLAVRRMLPKNTLSRYALRNLKVYIGAEHPHQAQIKKVA